MGRNLLIGVIALAVLGFLGLSFFGDDGGVQNPLASPEIQPAQTALPEASGEMTVTLQELNNSGQSGRAKLREEDGQVVITLDLSKPSQVEQPAHIHVGSCPEPGAIRYPLSNVVNGKSETTISTTLEQLKAQGELAINVHESPEKLETYTACGDLP